MVYQKNTNKLFSDLGKATRRGVRKCFKCGEINGTRGYSCKNKQCDAVFKEYADKRRINLEAVKLTGTSKQVYSVRVRDKGPDHRGFVQLPFIPSTINTHINLLTDNAICFVDSCQRLFDDSILRCHETELNNVSSSCVHVESALQSDTVATQINLKESTLNLIKIPSDVKQTLWDLITASQGAVIQRVSKHVMVVKCQVSAKHPLGYLHFIFGKSKGKDVFDKYMCSCVDIKTQSNDEFNHKCIHYYACVCSFASNSKLTEEFMNFINLEFEIGFTRIHFKNIRAQKNNALNKEQEKDTNLGKMKVKKLKNTRLKRNQLQKSKEKSKQHMSFTQKKAQNDNYLNFNNWFISIIELLNNSLNYDHNKNTLDSLIVFIPQNFFELFKEKINLHAPENCLPIYSEKYLRQKDSYSNIICDRYVWHITNIKNLIAIFNTPQLSLVVSKNYIKKQSQDFLQYETETISFKVGLNENNQDLTPFVIEWTPNIFHISKFGELKLKFSITHQLVK